MKTPDTCMFNVRFEHSDKFCDKSWDRVEPEEVPEKIKNVYPQFISVPITTPCGGALHSRTFISRCDKLWQDEVFLDVNPRICGTELARSKIIPLGEADFT